MEATIKEIATLLRSTEGMAAQFVQRVQTRFGQAVSPAEVLAAMRAMPAKSLSMEKVIAKLQQQRSAKSKALEHRTIRRTNRLAARKSALGAATAAPAPVAALKQPRTLAQRLDFVLQGNWDRAETEGQQPQRMSAEAFLNAIYQYTDRREGTHQRIMRAARQLDKADVVLTPALVADLVHELFER